MRDLKKKMEGKLCNKLGQLRAKGSNCQGIVSFNVLGCQSQLKWKKPVSNKVSVDIVSVIGVNKLVQQLEVSLTVS